MMILHYIFVVLFILSSRTIILSSSIVISSFCTLMLSLLIQTYIYYHHRGSFWRSIIFHNALPSSNSVSVILLVMIGHKACNNFQAVQLTWSHRKKLYIEKKQLTNKLASHTYRPNVIGLRISCMERRRKQFCEKLR